MAKTTDSSRETLARRAGMTVLVVIIAWTITAVTIGVLSGAVDDAPAPAVSEG